MTEKRSRIQFLVRGDEGDGYRVREVASTVAYLQNRPQRVAEEQWELAPLATRARGPRMYVLKNRVRERYVQLNERERFLWERMDGRTSLQELGTAYVLEFGAFDFELIPGLIAKLRQAELLTMRPASRLREVLAKNRTNPAARAAEAALRALERLNVASHGAHDRFVTAYRYGAFLLFTPWAVLVLAVLTVLGARGAVVLWHEGDRISAGLGQNPFVAIVLVKIFFWLTVISHQIVHALALVHYGRRVREFGFAFLHGFVPTFYADVTDIFLGSRRARIVTAVSGPLVHLFLAALYCWVASLLGPGLLQGFMAASAMLQIQSLFVSLYPLCFMEKDGYHLMVDLLGTPMLSHESVHFVHRRLFRRLRERRGFSRREWGYLAYYFLSLISVVAFVLGTIWVIVHAVVG